MSCSRVKTWVLRLQSDLSLGWSCGDGVIVWGGYVKKLGNVLFIKVLTEIQIQRGVCVCLCVILMCIHMCTPHVTAQID